ncbi:MAG: autotransporter-associated beta strand repeat-containing protein, partial [Burkholderiales bacterium]|nr:autotransporter-associated beta strand repeat-containing protein [Opitutaceae bacterium]
RLGALLLAACAPAFATSTTPAAPLGVPSDAPDTVRLAWPAVPGATEYALHRRADAGGGLAQSWTALSDTHLSTGPFPAGQPLTFHLVAKDASGDPSASSLDRLAYPAALRDTPAPGTAALTGSWVASGVVGSYGAASLYASPVAGGTPTATCTFAAALPVAGRYAVYARWTAHPNRAANTPFDIVNHNAVLATVRVDQTVPAATTGHPPGLGWYLLGEYELDAGPAASVLVRNNDASGYVVADAVQFVLLAFDSSAYSRIRLDDDFEGQATAPDPARWAVFDQRPDVRLEAGSLRTRISLKPSVTPLSSSDSDPRLAVESNWTEGGIIALDAQKFGYHEARLRLPAEAADGVDTAYWHNALDEYIHGYEIDGPEFFNRGVNLNYFSFGVWDHFLPAPIRADLDPGRTWNHKLIGSPAAYHTRCVTVGMELHTDNSTTVYLDGVKVHHAPPSGMNDVESILPARVILSTKVLSWLKPNLALHNAEAVWDYVRYSQKPGFSGALTADWSQPVNWSPGEAPAPGRAAVFNLPSTPAALFLPSDLALQSLYLDHPALPALVFSGPGALRLGAAPAGDDSVTHGGIALNTTVPTDQTVQNAIVGLAHLQFANLSRVSNSSLHLDGPISGDGLAPRDIDFLSSLETPSTGAVRSDLGAIILALPLGPGLRHVTRVGDTPFTLPAGSQHTGETRIARGPVVIPALSSLGLTPDAPLVFRPNYAHREEIRPRLLHTGPAATSARPLHLGGIAADGVLESSGSGPLVWAGDLVIAPWSGKAVQVLSRAPKLTLAASISSGANRFAGDIIDGAAVTYKNANGTDNTGPAILTLNKTGPGAWTLAGTVRLRANPVIDEGTLALAAGSTFELLAATPKITVRTGATLALERANAGTFPYRIEGSGGLRKLGAGDLTLSVANAYTGPTVVEAGRLFRDNTGSGRLEVLGGVFDLNGGNRGAPEVLLDGGEIANSTGTTTHYLSATSLYDLRSGLAAARLVGPASATKSGPGTVTLSAANTYTGGTTLTGGVLEITDTGSLGGAITITGGRLENRGTATGSVSVQLGGAISRVGAISGNLVNAGLITLTGNDPFAVSGTLTNTGTIDARAWHGAPSRLSGLGGTVQMPVINLAIAQPTGGTAALLAASTLDLSLTSTGVAPFAVTWTTFSGPENAAASFSSAALSTTATFPAPGVFVLRAQVADARGVSAQAYVRVIHNPARSFSFTAGVNNHDPVATFLRADVPSWNSGSRDQLLVGRFNGGLRPVFSFPLAGLPLHPVLFDTRLDLRVVGGVGATLDSLALHRLAAAPVEGTGLGVASTDGTGTGATWLDRAPAT